MTDNTTYLLDEFVNVRLGNPFRLFPFGKIVKNGKERVITPEMARLFKLPHFKPPLKLGSHEEATPAGGHIVELRVMDDGLYAVPEWNEKGETAMKDGAYRYHSPEIIWEDGALENPASGELIEGPMIVGDALLHTPHLGEAAKLYSVEPINKKGVKTMTVENVEIPKSLYDKFMALFDKPEKPEPEEPELNVVAADEYDAVVQERDNYKAKWEAHEKAQARKALVEKFEGELKDTKAADSAELAEILANLPDEQAGKLLQTVKALSAQADAGEVEEEIGGSGSAVDAEPAAQFNAAVLAIQAKENVSYNTALEMAKVNHKDMFEAYLKAGGK